MILLQPPGHLVQRDQPGGGENSCLAHASAERFTKIARPLDVIPAAHQHGADRGAQALGEAEHDRGKATGQPVYRRIQRGGGIEDAGAIEMHGQAGIGGAGPDFLRYLERHHRATGQVVRVLERYQAGPRAEMKAG